MKSNIFYFLVFSFVLMSCSPPAQIGVSGDLSTQKYMEAVLRTRNVFAVSKNMDRNNPIQIDFVTYYADQLVEFNFNARTLKSTFLTLTNSDLSYDVGSFSLSSPAQLLLGDLQIRLNGQDITQCVLNECNATRCDGGAGSTASFSGYVSTQALYINLTKLDRSSNPECSSINLGTGKTVHQLELSEASLFDPNNQYGSHIEAQVLVYNRTYRPETIMNTFGAW